MFPASFRYDIRMSDSLKHPAELRLVAEMEAMRGSNHGQSVLKTWLAGDFSTLPQRAIHVAGTNGKGSVITWLEVLLKQKKQSTGSFISPHLISHNERLRLSGKPIAMEKWLQIYKSWRTVFQARKMTMFEMDLWMALALFEEQRPDWVLIETGLGGGRDATTALDYPIGIITQTGMDHMAFLGGSRPEIAEAKAGIIKEDMLIVSAEKDPDCLMVYESACQKAPAGFFLIDEDLDFSGFWKDSLPAYQKDNFLCALKALQLAGFAFTKEELAEAVDAFFWPARFEILRENPLLILDGAHNPDGIEALVKSLAGLDPKLDAIYFSVLADKQAAAMLKTLQSLDAKIHLVRFEETRLADLQKLADAYDLDVLSLDEMMDRLKSENKRALVCGSLYFAGAVLERWKAEHPKSEEAAPAEAL